MFTNHMLQKSIVVGLFAVSGAAVAQQQAPAQQPPPTQQPAPAQQPPPTQQPAPAQQPAPKQYPPPQYQYPPQYQQYPPQYQQYPPQYPYPPQYHTVQPEPAQHESLVHGYFQGGFSDAVGKTSDYLQGGYSFGAGFSVAPAPGSPVAFRFDVNYSRNSATTAFVNLNQSTNSAINEGNERIWSGTLDLEFRVPLGGGVHAYLLGGGGAYNTRLSFREPVYVRGGYYGGYGGYDYCDPFMGFCGGGFGEVNVASHTVTKFGWNAGAGLDFPLGNGASWFIEGRYNRVRVSNASIPIAYVPITVGLRF
jgi:opacity protein-like surface antigen